MEEGDLQEETHKAKVDKETVPEAAGDKSSNAVSGKSIAEDCGKMEVQLSLSPDGGELDSIPYLMVVSFPNYFLKIVWSLVPCLTHCVEHNNYHCGKCPSHMCFHVVVHVSRACVDHVA